MTKKYCPNCNAVVETKTIPTGYEQIPYQNTFIKKRQVTHRIEDGGCSHIWFTYEIPEDVMRSIAPILFNPEWEV